MRCRYVSNAGVCRHRAGAVLGQSGVQVPQQRAGLCAVHGKAINQRAARDGPLGTCPTHTQQL